MFINEWLESQMTFILNFIPLAAGHVHSRLLSLVRIPVNASLAIRNHVLQRGGSPKCKCLPQRSQIKIWERVYKRSKTTNSQRCMRTSQFRCLYRIEIIVWVVLSLFLLNWSTMFKLFLMYPMILTTN